MPATVARASATNRMRRGYSKSLRARTHDTRARASIVQAAAIAPEERGQETEAGWHCEDCPHQRAYDRVRQIGRCANTVRYDLDPERHLSQRLSAGRERHEIADVLEDEKCQQRNLRE